MSSTPRNPSELSKQSAFIRVVAQQVEVQSSYTVSRLTTILGRYIDWAHRIRGLDLVPGLLFNRQVIDLYIRHALNERHLAKSSVASYRAVLNRAAEIFLPSHDAARPTPVSARPITAPYSGDELRGVSAWRRGQRTPLQRRKATALLALGLGCGLRAREVLALRRSHITIDSPTDVVVTVWSGNIAREVPMTTRWARPFADLVSTLEPDDHIFGDPHRTRSNPNAIGEFIASTNRGFALSTYRMRSTWIVGRLTAGVELRTLLDAAGLARLEKLAEYLPYLPASTDNSFNRLRVEVTR
jgi:integrase